MRAAPQGIAAVVRSLGHKKRGRARLVGPDGHQTVLPESIYRVILTQRAEHVMQLPLDFIPATSYMFFLTYSK